MKHSLEEAGQETKKLGNESLHHNREQDSTYYLLLPQKNAHTQIRTNLGSKNVTLPLFRRLISLVSLSGRTIS